MSMLCASQIIFGKISQLEMLFRLFGVLCELTHIVLTFRNSSCGELTSFLASLRVLRKPQQRAVKGVPNKLGNSQVDTSPM